MLCVGSFDSNQLCLQALAWAVQPQGTLGQDAAKMMLTLVLPGHAVCPGPPAGSLGGNASKSEMIYQHQSYLQALALAAPAQGITQAQGFKQAILCVVTWEGLFLAGPASAVPACRSWPGLWRRSPNS